VIGAQGDRRISFLRPRSVGYPVGCPYRPPQPPFTPWFTLPEFATMLYEGMAAHTDRRLWIRLGILSAVAGIALVLVLLASVR
jgi:hypothetical protein